jgi:hypothetical protein
VEPLLFRLFLIVAEPAVLLNTVDEELGQPLADVEFQGLQNCQRAWYLRDWRKFFQGRCRENRSFCAAWITSGAPRLLLELPLRASAVQFFTLCYLHIVRSIFVID